MKYHCACNFELWDPNNLTEDPILYHSYIPCDKDKKFNLEDISKALVRVIRQYVIDEHKGDMNYPTEGITHTYNGLGPVEEIEEEYDKTL